MQWVPIQHTQTGYQVRCVCKSRVAHWFASYFYYISPDILLLSKTTQNDSCFLYPHVLYLYSHLTPSPLV